MTNAPCATPQANPDLAILLSTFNYYSSEDAQNVAERFYGQIIHSADIVYEKLKSGIPYNETLVCKNFIKGLRANATIEW